MDTRPPSWSHLRIVRRHCDLVCAAHPPFGKADRSETRCCCFTSGRLLLSAESVRKPIVQTLNRIPHSAPQFGPGGTEARLAPPPQGGNGQGKPLSDLLLVVILVHIASRSAGDAR